MNKFLRSELVIELTIVFGIFVCLLCFLFEQEYFAYIFGPITLVIVIVNYVYLVLFISKYKDTYIKSHSKDTELENKEDNIIYQIKRYKKDTIIYNLFMYIIEPFYVIDLLLGYNIFKDVETLKDIPEYIMYLIIFLTSGITIYSLIKITKEIIELSKVDIDLENNNIEIIKAKPISIKPLYYGSGKYNDKVRIGYGIVITFDKHLSLTALIDFPYIGRKRMKSIIEEELLDKTYNLTYLKNSKIITKLDSKLIRALK